MQDLTGRVAVVTGAAGGIGRALCKRFIAEGASVVLADADKDGLAEVAESSSVEAGTLECIVTDITDPESVDSLAAQTFERFGRVDVLCANVGIMGPTICPVWETPLGDWQNVLGVNLFGTVHTVRAFVPAMLAARREGHIVVTASMAALTAGTITTAPYIASKHAARAIAETLRRNLEDVGSILGVSVLCPGPVNTGMLANVRTAYPAFDNAHAAVGGNSVLEPQEVAGRVIEAVKDGTFYIFTHPDSRGRVVGWFDSILSDLPN